MFGSLSIREKIMGVAIILLVALSYFGIDGCNGKRDTSKDYNTLLKIHMRDSSELVEKTNQLGEVTTTAKAYELSQKDLDKYVSENKDLKNKLANAYHHIGSINTTITNLHIDTIKVPVHDTIPCGDIDRSYPVLDRYYSFVFKFKNRSGHNPEYNFINFNIPDTSVDVIGIKKSGFLNLKHTLVSEQTHSNKYINIKGNQTIVKSEAKPKTFKKLAIGFGIGILTTIVVEQKLKH